MTHTSLILLTTCSYPWILFSSYAQYHQPEYQKNKEHVDGEETRWNVNIDKIAIMQQWTEILFQQLHNYESVLSSDWVLWEIVEKGTVFNYMWKYSPNLLMSFVFAILWNV